MHFFALFVCLLLKYQWIISMILHFQVLLCMDVGLRYRCSWQWALSFTGSISCVLISSQRNKGTRIRIGSHFLLKLHFCLYLKNSLQVSGAPQEWVWDYLEEYVDSKEHIHPVCVDEHLKTCDCKEATDKTGVLNVEISDLWELCVAL